LREQTYRPPKGMLNFIQKFFERKKWGKITWETFNCFSKLPKKKTLMLWNKYLPSLSQSKGSFIHPLIALLISNKLFLEKNKTMAEIASEVRELFSKLDRPINVSYTFTVELNKFLNIRKPEETERKGLRGGAKKRLSEEKKSLIIDDLKNSNYTLTEIANRHKVSYTTVYRMAPEFRQLKTKSKRSDYYRLPPEKKERILDLIKDGVSFGKISDQEKVSMTTISRIAHSMGIWRHSRLDSRQAKLGRILFNNNGKLTLQEIAKLTGFSEEFVRKQAAKMRQAGAEIVFKQNKRKAKK
jgi:transposase-like protein